MAYDPRKQTKGPNLTKEDLKNIGITDPRWVGYERIPIHPAIRKKVWEKRFSSANSGKCVCCNEHIIYAKAFFCGHRTAIANKGGNEVHNLEPICSRCNSQMGKNDLDSWCRDRKFH